MFERLMRRLGYVPVGVLEAVVRDRDRIDRSRWKQVVRRDEYKREVLRLRAEVARLSAAVTKSAFSDDLALRIAHGGNA